MSTWTPHLSWLDIVHEYFPDVTNAQAREILWTKTDYLINDGTDGHRIEEFCRQLNSLIDR